MNTITLDYAEYDEMLEELRDLRKFKRKIEDRRESYKKLKDNKHRMNYMKKDPNAIGWDFISSYSTIEYDSNWNKNRMYIRSEEELLWYIKEIIAKWKYLWACTLYIRHEWEEPRY